MQIRERIVGDVTILDLAGPLTFGEGETAFRRHISRLIGDKKRAILLNLEKVEFLDSSGVGALVQYLTSIARSGGKLKALRAGPMVVKVLKITGVHNLIEFYDDERKAVASF
ncbi:MAG: STAS domain-containing protein [Acidobacteriota bacterium]